MKRIDVSAEKLTLIAKRLRECGSGSEYWLSDPLAVIGLGCRFPGGVTNPREFWRLLWEGRDAITEVPPRRWNLDACYDPNPEARGKVATRWGGFLEDENLFDASFFGVSPREAADMDPQQRILLEVVWEALENAGQPPHRLSGSATAVFMGVIASDYDLMQKSRPDLLDVYSATGSAANILAGRIAYLLDLRGPAVALDTACSSSLVAVHMACQSLRSGECDLALAGGVNLLLEPASTVGLSRMRMLSPDGRCKAFDARADGFVRSDGCGVVVLKRLSDALAMNDPIVALIRGTAVNQDGRSVGLTAPNGAAQEAVMRQALRNACVEAEAVEYVEAHGTGTPLGDPIEVEALTAVYGVPADRGCVLGSVKTNIGHAEAAAGMAGLIKAVLALRHEAIPANLHLERVNPNLALEGTRLELARSPREWRRGARRRHAAVSSFGWSGTNAHLVLEEAPERDEDDGTSETRDRYVLPLSARSVAALQQTAQRHAAELGTTELRHWCYTAGLRRTHHRCRVAVVGSTAEEIAAKLGQVEAAEPVESRGVVFVYPGHGGQWPGMGRELYQREEVFRRAIVECGARIREEAGWDLEAEILGGDWQAVERVQPGLFAMSLGLTALWRHWGLEPQVVVGHSLGEVAAAYVAGALSLDQAIKVICRRGELSARVRGQGGMAVVALGESAAADAVASSGGKVNVAVINDRRSTVVSGEREALAELMREWEGRGLYCRWVQIDFASHSGQVKGVGEDLERELRGLKPARTRVRMVSPVTGHDVGGEELDGAYWRRNLCDEVRFGELMEKLAAEGYRTYVEVGPHPVLVGAIREALAKEPGVIVGSLRREAPERAMMLESLAALYAAGAEVDWGKVNGERGRCVELPGYAWQHEPYWLEKAGRRRDPGTHHVEVAGDRRLHVFGLEDVAKGHRVMGREVVAAAEYVERALRAADEAWGKGPWEVWGLELEQMLESGREAQLVLEGDGETGRFEVYSRGNGEDDWLRHGYGELRRGQSSAFEPLEIQSIRSRCKTHVNMEDFYQMLARQGLDYGNEYRQVAEVWAGDREAVARLRKWHLDASLQALSHATESNGEVSVPVRITRTARHADVKGELWAWARWQNGSGTVQVVDNEGRHVAAIEGVELRTVGKPENQWLWEMRWEEEAAEVSQLRGRWLLCGGTAELAEALVERGAECVQADLARIRVAVSAADAWTGVLWEAGEEDGIEGAVELAQALLAQGWRDAPRLYLVTHGTQAAGGGVTCMRGAGLWGFGRSLIYEHPEFRTKLIDTTTGAAELAAEIACASDENQIALRPGVRFIARLRPMEIPQEPDCPLFTALDEPFQIEIARPGLFDRLRWRACERRAPGQGEIEVEIAAAGLNFLDVLAALGEYPGQTDRFPIIGHEFAGRVTRVHPSVSGLQPGDEVLGCADGSFASHAIASANSVIRKPETMTFETAAGQGIAFATAWHALVRMARLGKRETVLIHSAATGTGLAALEIAEWLGAEVWATAGTPQKREYLRQRGVQHVMDSRTLEFADQVLGSTGGCGVDVALNSLAGDGMRATMRATARFGRFVELGKRDLWMHDRIATEPFRKNLSYFPVDLLALGAERPEDFRQTLENVIGHLAAGDWKPLPVEAFQPDMVADAFYRMAQGRHQGKLVVGLQDRKEVGICRSNRIRGDAAYLISGGLGGIGLRLAEWMAAQGARQLVLVGRRPPDLAQQAVIDKLRTAGVEIAIHLADVAQRDQVDRVLASLRVPLRGIVHAAAVLEDRVLSKLDRAAIERVWRPKVTGAWTLHEASRGMRLDFFILMSSAASLLGSPGQINYAAANAWLDAFADWRRGQGLPGMSINWGPWGEIGMAAKLENQGARIADRGMTILSPEVGLEMFGRLLPLARSHASVMQLNLRQWRQFYPNAAIAALSGLETDSASVASSGANATRAALEAAGPARRRELLEAQVREHMARVLRTSPAAIRSDTPFLDLGVDSLIAIEFRNRLEAALSISLSATVLWAHSTVPDLVEHLAETMNLPLAVSAPAESLDQEAAEAELIAKLQEL